MAESTKLIREKLQILNCPYIEGLDDVTVHELLLSHSQARIRLLEWLLESAVPGLLQRETPSIRPFNDDYISRLALLFSELQICTAQDHDLIKGTASTGKCIKFLDGLTDLVTNAVNYRTTNDSHSNISQDMNTSCCFLDDLCLRHGNLATVLPSDVTLIPPTLNHMLKRGGANQYVPSLVELNERMNDLTFELTHHEKALKEMTEKGNYFESNGNGHSMGSTTTTTICQSLEVSLTTLNQLIDNFIHCYSTDVQQWTVDKRRGKFDKLGSTASRLASHLSLINELLESIDRLSVASNALVSLGKREMKHCTVEERGKSLYDEIHSNFEHFIESPN